MDENKSFWQSLAELGAGVYNNTVNQKANAQISANTSASVAGVVRFGIIVVTLFMAGKFIVSLFKGK